CPGRRRCLRRCCFRRGCRPTGGLGRGSACAPPPCWPKPDAPTLPVPPSSNTLERVKAEPDVALRPISFHAPRRGAARDGAPPPLRAARMVNALYFVPAPIQLVPIVHAAEPPGVGLVRGVIAQLLRVVAEAVRSTRPRPAGVFPLRLAGQAIPVATKDR